jgi:PAS domain S-box-containing protein
LVTVGFLAVLTAVFTVLLQQIQQHTFIAGTEHELRTAALMAKELLPPGYHERIDDKTSVSDVEYQQIVERFNKLCVKADLEYLWSLMVLDGQIVFTSATSPSKDVRQRDHAGFLEVHSNPELYTKAFETMLPEFRTNEDKWGRIQVMLVPFRDGRGRPCLMGASRSLRELDARLRETLLSSLSAGGLILVLGALACLYLARLLSRPIEEVTRTAAAIAKGDLSNSVKVRGGQELELLASSINAMTQAIRERVQALAESEQRFSVFLANLPAAAFIKNREGKILLANQYQRELVGGKESWTNKRFEDLLPAEVAARMAAEDRRAMAEGLTVVEESICDAQGHTHVLETHRFPVPLPGGTQLLGGIALDITKRKQLEEYLRRSQKM